MNRLSKIKKVQKPKILKTKIELATLIKEKVNPILFNKSPMHNYYWKGHFEINGVKYRIFFQLYSTSIKRGTVDYVDIRFLENYKALTVTEIKKLLEEVKAL